MAGLPEYSVQPGQLRFSRGPEMIRTILGSCVSVTFWSARLGAGALCHGILPRCPAGTSGAESHRYVDSSIRYLAKQFDALGARRQDVEVKLFGGADVVPVPTARDSKPTVGALNCETALEVLRDEGFTVLAADLGGLRGRTIYFDTGTGEVFVRLLPSPGAAAPRANDATPPLRNRRAL